MDKEIARQQIEKIFKVIFGIGNPFSMEQIEEDALEILSIAPRLVNDAMTGQPTWTADEGEDKYIAQVTMQKYDTEKGWGESYRSLDSLEAVLSAWEKINYCVTERVQDSMDVSESDLIYNCENVYRSSNCRASKNLFFCDDVGDSEFMLASQRSGSCSFGIKISDSIYCSNSYQIDYCNKVANSYFVRNCFDLYECMFCAHLASRRFCIANMQFSKDDYYKLKVKIVNWILEEDGAILRSRHKNGGV